jgi:hypothetical protein
MTEPAEGNRANEALVKVLSKKLKSKTICIVSGMRARNRVPDFGNDLAIEYVFDKSRNRLMSDNMRPIFHTHIITTWAGQHTSKMSPNPPEACKLGPYL